MESKHFAYIFTALYVVLLVVAFRFGEFAIRPIEKPQSDIIYIEYVKPEPPPKPKPKPAPKPDNSYTWTPRKSTATTFEEMMNQFKQSSDEKFSDLKRKNPEAKRSKRGAVK